MNSNDLLSHRAEWRWRTTRRPYRMGKCDQKPPQRQARPRRLYNFMAPRPHGEWGTPGGDTQYCNCGGRACTLPNHCPTPLPLLWMLCFFFCISPLLIWETDFVVKKWKCFWTCNDRDCVCVYIYIYTVHIAFKGKSSVIQSTARLSVGKNKKIWYNLYLKANWQLGVCDRFS